MKLVKEPYFDDPFFSGFSIEEYRRWKKYDNLLGWEKSKYYTPRHKKEELIGHLFNGVSHYLTDSEEVSLLLFQYESRPLPRWTRNTRREEINIFTAGQLLKYKKDLEENKIINPITKKRINPENIVAKQLKAQYYMLVKKLEGLSHDRMNMARLLLTENDLTKKLPYGILEKIEKYINQNEHVEVEKIKMYWDKKNSLPKKTSPKKKCPEGKILNPYSGRCVKIDGKKGKELWLQRTSSPQKKSPQKSPKKDYSKLSRKDLQQLCKENKKQPAFKDIKCTSSNAKIIEALKKI